MWGFSLWVWFASMEMSVVFILQYLNVVYHIDWFVDVESSLHPCDSSLWSWCMILSMCCCMCFQPVSRDSQEVSPSHYILGHLSNLCDHPSCSSQWLSICQDSPVSQSGGVISVQDAGWLGAALSGSSWERCSQTPSRINWETGIATCSLGNQPWCAAQPWRCFSTCLRTTSFFTTVLADS